MHIASTFEVNRQVVTGGSLIKTERVTLLAPGDADKFCSKFKNKLGFINK